MKISNAHLFKVVIHLFKSDRYKPCAIYFNAKTQRKQRPAKKLLCEALRAQRLCVEFICTDFVTGISNKPKEQGVDLLNVHRAEFPDE